MNKKFLVLTFSLIFLTFSATAVLKTLNQPSKVNFGKGLNPLFAENLNKTVNILIVRGTGVVETFPDQAKINLQVETEASTAKEAVTTNAEKMTNVINKLKSIGIPKEKIETTYFSIYPVYSESPPYTAIGYKVNNRVMVTTNKTYEIGKIIDAAVEAGANKVNGVYFTLSDQKMKEIEKIAIKKAVENAETKAEAIAESAQIKLTKIINIAETGIYKPAPVNLYEIAKAETGASTPISPGQIKVTATIQITYMFT